MKDLPYTIQLELIMNIHHMAVISVASTIDLDDNYLISGKQIFFKIAVVSHRDIGESKFLFRFSRELSMLFYSG